MYNFDNSLSRIDKNLESKESNDIMDTLPKLKTIDNRKTIYSYASVMTIRYKIEKTEKVNFNDNSKNDNSRSVIKSFINEVLEIIYPCEHLRDFKITNGCITLIYDTPLKATIFEVIKTAAKIRTIAMIISRKSKYKGLDCISTSIGIDYGTISLQPIFVPFNEKIDYIYSGEPFDNSEYLSYNSDDNKIIITEMVWKNSNEIVQKIFDKIEINGIKCYSGNVVHSEMNEWLENFK